MAEIKFDNVLLEEVAPHIKIDDIVVSPLSYNATVNDRPTQPGRFFVRQTAASRTVTITFALLTDNRTIGKPSCRPSGTGRRRTRNT